MIERRWYYVQDSYGNVPCVEPFPTFSQASYFRGMIQSEYYGHVDLHIRSYPREGVPEKEKVCPPSTIRETYQNSEF